MTAENSWRPDKTTLDAMDRKLLADVEEYGWHCLHIHDEGQVPHWTFTVGVYRTWTHPEFVVFGLPDTVAHDVMKDLVERVAAGETFSSGRLYADVFEGDVAGRFVEVDRRAYSTFMGYAQWFYETVSDFPVLQLVWPDKGGRFPWAEGYAVEPEYQPVLVSEEAFESARGPH